MKHGNMSDNESIRSITNSGKLKSKAELELDE